MKNYKKNIIIDILENEDEYNDMKYVAINKGIDEFSYSKIATRSLVI